MGNHRMEHCCIRINTTSPIMSKVVVVETQRQPTRIVVTQSFYANVTTIWNEMVVAPNMGVVKRGILTKFVAKLGSGLGGVLTRRKLSGNLILPTTTTRVFRTSQMVFTNLTMIIHVNRTIDWPSMSSMATKGYRNVDATYPRGEYQEPFVVIALVPSHRLGYYVRPNRVVLKYLDFKKKCWSRCSY